MRMVRTHAVNGEAECTEDMTYDGNVIAGTVAFVTDLALESFACNAFGKLETRRGPSAQVVIG